MVSWCFFLKRTYVHCFCSSKNMVPFIKKYKADIILRIYGYTQKKIPPSTCIDMILSSKHKVHVCGSHLKRIFKLPLIHIDTIKTTSLIILRPAPITSGSPCCESTRYGEHWGEGAARCFSLEADILDEARIYPWVLDDRMV